MLNDYEIAQSARLAPVHEIAARLGIPERYLQTYGPYKAKISLEFLSERTESRGRLILVSAITPTPAGEGKTTVTIGLGQALCRLGDLAAAVIGIGVYAKFNLGMIRLGGI